MKADLNTLEDLEARLIDLEEECDNELEKDDSKEAEQLFEAMSHINYATDYISNYIDIKKEQGKV